MKKSFALLLCSCLTFALVAGTGTAADAKSKPKVTISKIANKTAKYKKSVTVKVPRTKAHGKTKIIKVVMTVKKGSKTKASKKRSVKLKAGKYKVTTYAYYRTYVWQTRYEPLLVYPAWSTVSGTTCVIDSVSGPVAPYNFSASCSGLDFDGSFQLQGTATARFPSDPPAELGEERGWDLSTGVALEAEEDPQSLVGKSFDGSLTTPVDLFDEQGIEFEEKVFSKTKVLKKKQKLTIKQGKKPGSTAPISLNDCPSWAPIKGNISESRGTKIYHLPGGRWYDVTNPEICFSSVKAAKKAGFRASKNG